MTLFKNMKIKIKIDSLTSRGGGVGRFEGMAVFVENSAAGDFLEVNIIKVSKNYAIGKIEKILKPSPDRIEADCPVCARCGGCAFRHISYEAELAAKQGTIQDALLRIGKSEIKINPIVKAENTLRYRNKAQYPVRAGKNGVQIGFYARNSHRVADCDDCLLTPPEFTRITEICRDFINENGIMPYDEITKTGEIRHLYMRKAEKTGEIIVCFVVNGKGFSGEDLLAERLKAVTNITGILINTNKDDTNVVLGEKFRTVYGRDFIFDELCGVRLKISPRSFYQVNHTQTEKLYEIAADFAGLTGCETVLDLYCGTGTIGLSMAKKAKEIIGVEIIPEAIENAKENASMNSIDNARFLCADAKETYSFLNENRIKPDVIILDPPRKGCSPEVIDIVIGLRPESIVYVSCDPATLARDVRIFEEKGYKAERGTPVDLFPRTVHVECVVLMSRVDK